MKVLSVVVALSLGVGISACGGQDGSSKEVAALRREVQAQAARNTSTSSTSTTPSTAAVADPDRAYCISYARWLAAESDSAEERAADAAEEAAAPKVIDAELATALAARNLADSQDAFNAAMDRVDARCTAMLRG